MSLCHVILDSKAPSSSVIAQPPQRNVEHLLHVIRLPGVSVGAAIDVHLFGDRVPCSVFQAPESPVSGQKGICGDSSGREEVIGLCDWRLLNQRRLGDRRILLAPFSFFLTLLVGRALAGGDLVQGLPSARGSSAKAWRERRALRCS